jgi:hypothetical protein
VLPNTTQFHEKRKYNLKFTKIEIHTPERRRHNVRIYFYSVSFPTGLTYMEKSDLISFYTSLYCYSPPKYYECTLYYLKMAW